MTDDEIRAVVAKACGWKLQPDGIYWHRKIPGHYEPEIRGGGILEEIPNYPSDLNACAEMIAAMVTERPGYYERAFITELCGVFQMDQDTGMHDKRSIFQLLNATARQRCEAFLKVKSLWREWKP